MKNKIITAIFLLVALVFSVFLIYVAKMPINTNNSKNVTAINQNKEKTNIVTKETNSLSKVDEDKEKAAVKTEPGAALEAVKDKEIKIKAFGDIMFHGDQTKHAKLIGKGKYNYDVQFERMKDFVSDSDLSIANFETTCNPNLAPSDYPQFNVPKEVLSSLKKIGFDAFSTVNNHSMDTGIGGIDATIDSLKEAGFKSFGTQHDKNAPYTIVDVKGVKVGLLGYSFGFNGLEVRLRTQEQRDKVNFLEPQKIKNDIEKIKEQGAEVVIVYPHWGTEYQSYPDDSQVRLGRQMISWGADFVIGNHPHVIQPKEEYTAKNGNKGFIIYACGNFISCQTRGYFNTPKVEHSVGVELDIKYNKVTKKKEFKVTTHPILVTIIQDDYWYRVQTLLVKDHLPGGKYANDVPGNKNKFVEEAQFMINKVLNTKIE